MKRHHIFSIKHSGYLIFLFNILWITTSLNATEILRFEHYNTARGLSQNTVSSVLCDSKGFLWIGTNNGLNRYDGNAFKVYMNETNGTQNFTHNRIVNIWEDYRGFIWFETHDGHYHYFNPVLEQFISLSTFFEDDVDGHVFFSDFLQYSDDEIWLGLHNRGVIRLTYNTLTGLYNKTHYTSRGVNSVSNEKVTFIKKDQNENIWIGTEKGLTLVESESLSEKAITFQHLFITHSFKSFLETATELWFATADHGILKFQKSHKLYTFTNTQNTPSLTSDEITGLHITKTGVILATFQNKGLQRFNLRQNLWQSTPLHGNQVELIYEDRFNRLWITTEEFGITGINIDNWSTKHYQFFNPKIGTIPDAERHVFFEDSNNNLWIGTHEGALNRYDRINDAFTSFRNDPNNPNSIASNTVLSIEEDHSGQLWVGTGQYQGGLERIIIKEEGFQHIKPQKISNHISDNIVRALVEDNKNRLWIGTKSGRLHVFENDKQLIVFDRFRTQNEVLTGVNLYNMFIDKDGHLWLGSKGKGLLISQLPLDKYNNLSDITYINYQPDANDSTTISSANIYSITQDQQGTIWVGTYGNGLNKVKINTSNNRTFIRITAENSGLSSNLVRNVMADSKNRIWIATSYGLNMLQHDENSDKFEIKTFYAGNKPDDLNLNDVIHLYEDSSGRIWAATFGGGVNVLKNLTEKGAHFKKYTQASGLSNNIVYGILEDNANNLWFSTENGISRFNNKTNTFEVYNSNNGLNFESFSENTAIKNSKGQLIFGGFLGVEIITPDKIISPFWKNSVEITSFQLFNKEVSVGKDSPLQKSISYTNEITLKHFQSSFSFEFSALDYLDTDKILYAYKLENFEEDWNQVTKERKATYTNLAPGKYVFKLRTTNREGEWIKKERTIYINILPPWYKTRWAYISYSLLLVGMLYIIFSTISKINRYRNDLKIERKVNEMKLRFFTNISHEIRTPLTLIIGPIEDLLKKGRLDNSDKPKLEIINRNGKRMLQLTNQLLDFRKIQNNRMRLKVNEFDIVHFTKNIYESFEPLANHKNIKYNFSSSSQNVYVWADASKIDMIVYNLISNALKFTDANKEVSVSILQDSQTHSIKLIVSDKGRGIAKENLPQLFDRYTILSGEELAGTGIGLSLAKELAKLHYADILVDSESGIGSTFTLILKEGKTHFANDPKVIWNTNGENEQIHKELDHPELPIEDIETENNQTDNPADASKPLIMVVEDNHEIGSYISQSLSPEFMSCNAENGEEALNMLQLQNPDLIISDIMMPIMDGMELTKRIKENFATSHIPIILLTSKSGVDDQIAGVELGADAYITKPFNSNFLKAVAKNLVEQRRNVIAKFRDNKTIDPSTLKVNSKDEEFLHKLVSYVQDNHSEEFTIEELADKLFVSRTVFYNKVKGLTGLSPVEFVRQLKLKIAAELLLQGYNVSEAAIKVGFSDARYFSRQFKALFGYLPSKHGKEPEKDGADEE